jgi:hypothetical protein
MSEHVNAQTLTGAQNLITYADADESPEKEKQPDLINDSESALAILERPKSKTVNNNVIYDNVPEYQLSTAKKHKKLSSKVLENLNDIIDPEPRKSMKSEK